MKLSSEKEAKKAPSTTTRGVYYCCTAPGCQWSEYVMQELGEGIRFIPTLCPDCEREREKCK